MQSDNDRSHHFYLLLNQVWESSEAHQFTNWALHELKRVDLQATPNALTEASNKERAKQAVSRYIEEYNRFASSVLTDLEQQKPDSLPTYKLFYAYTSREFQSLLRSVKATTDADAAQLETVVKAFTALMNATEYLDDRAAMISHAFSQFKSRLEKLGLLEPASHQDVVASAHLDEGYFLRWLQAARNWLVHSQFTPRTTVWSLSPSPRAARRSDASLTYWLHSLQTQVDTEQSEQASGEQLSPNLYWISASNLFDISRAARESQSKEPARPKVLHEFQVSYSPIEPARESSLDLSFEQRSSVASLEHGEAATSELVGA